MVPLARSVFPHMSHVTPLLTLSQARGGSKHLEFLLDNKLIKISPSAMLRTAYTEAMMDKKLWDLNMEFDNVGSKSSIEAKTAPQETEEKLLLSQSSRKLIADCLEVPELAVEIQRAVWQVERSLKAKEELQEEKAEIESANKTHSNQ